MNEKIQIYDTKMTKTIGNLNSELGTIRAGRANPHVLDRIMVDYYGVATSLQQVANITVPEARLLQISLWDTSMIKEVVKAINASDIGITPTDDGKVIRLVFPQLTEERRKELSMQVHKIGEEYKVTLRNARRDILDKIKEFKKNNIITEDDVETFGKDVQKILDKNIADIDTIIKNKEAEVFEV